MSKSIEDDLPSDYENFDTDGLDELDAKTAKSCVFQKRRPENNVMPFSSPDQVNRMLNDT